MFCLSQFCCCCLKKHEQLTSISKLDSDNVSFRDKFKFCYLRMDSDTDDVPKLLCRECCSGIAFMYNFRKMYLERQKCLRGYINDLKQINKEYTPRLTKLSIEILNADFLLNSSDQTFNIKDTPFDTRSKESKLIFKSETEDLSIDNNKNDDSSRQDEDLFAIDVQTVNFTLNNPITIHDETTNEDSNTQQCEESEESALQFTDDSIREESSSDNYEIVKTNEEISGTSKQNGDVFNIADNDSNVLRIVRNKPETSSLKIVFRKSNRESRDSDFICNICDKVFQSERELNLHITSHNIKTEFLCIFCSKKFVNLRVFRKHERLHPDKPYNCKICDKLILRKAAYRMHMSHHTGNYKFQCNICDKGLASKQSLMNHKLTHYKKRKNNNKTKQSSISEALFTPNNFYTPSKAPTTPNNPDKTLKPQITPENTDNDKFRRGTFEATITQNVDEFRKALTMINQMKGTSGRHKKSTEIQVVTKKRGRPPKLNRKRFKLSCDKCDKSFVNRFGLEKHTFRFHTTHKCQVCFKKFKSKVLLGLHRKKNADCRLGVSWKKKYICEICDKRFQFNMQLKQHLKSHVDDTDDEETTTTSQTLESLKINLTNNNIPETSQTECNYCNRKFLNKIQLDLHLLIHTGFNKFNCKYCPHKFCSKVKLQNHVSRMHKQSIYKCKFCSKYFKLRLNLNKHMIVFHVKESVKHSCEFCDKSFLKLSILRQHKKTHTVSEKMYKCTECNKGFIQKCNLIRHLVIHTNEMSYECNICSKRFKLAHTMITHMKNCHDTEHFEL